MRIPIGRRTTAGARLVRRAPAQVDVRSVWRIGRIAIGTTCVGLGLAGLFLPFLQGILLLVIGLSLLSSESERAQRWHEWLLGWIRRRGMGKRKREDVNGRERSIG